MRRQDQGHFACAIFRGFNPVSPHLISNFSSYKSKEFFGSHSTSCKQLLVFLTFW
jgi:hypothetical protein